MRIEPTKVQLLAAEIEARGISKFLNSHYTDKELDKAIDIILKELFNEETSE